MIAITLRAIGYTRNRKDIAEQHHKIQRIKKGL